MVNIVHDIDLIQKVKEYDVILIGTTINNSLGNGFQKSVERSFFRVGVANRTTRHGDKTKLGKVLVVEDYKPTFCLCYVYNTRMRPYETPDVLDYEALRECLKYINNKFNGKKIASTVIGNSPYEGGGDYDKIINIINNELTDINIDLYDYEQPNYRILDNISFKSIISQRVNGDISREEYEDLKKKYLWEKHFGIYEEMPYGLTYNELKKYVKDEENKRRYT